MRLFQNDNNYKFARNDIIFSENQCNNHRNHWYKICGNDNCNEDIFIHYKKKMDIIITFFKIIVLYFHFSSSNEKKKVRIIVKIKVLQYLQTT